MNELEMKICPFCAEEIKIEAIKCRYCATNLNRGSISETWYRISENKIIWGVCTGLSHVFGISITVVRFAFILSTLFGGWGIVFYLILRIIMPLKQDDDF